MVILHKFGRLSRPDVFVYRVMYSIEWSMRGALIFKILDKISKSQKKFLFLVDMCKRVKDMYR